MIVELRSPDSVRTGEPVPMTLTVTNAGQTTAPLGLTGRPIAFDFTVTTPAGAQLWSRLHHQTIPMILQMALLDPGERLEFTHVWDQRDNHGQPVDPGTYHVRAILPTEDGDLTSAVRELVIAR